MNTHIYRLKDISTIKSGKRLPAGHDFAGIKTRHTYVRARDIKNGKISSDNLAFISDLTYEKIKRYIIEKGDVAITVVANIGDIGYCEEDCHGANLTENAIRLTNINKKLVDSRFLALLLGQPAMKQHMEALAAGAAQAKLGIYKIENIEVSLPDIKSQYKIVSIISSYDTLIDINTKRIKLLKETACELYKEWFVRMRFPGYEQTKFVKGIPEGWNYLRIDEISDLSAGGDKPKDFSELMTDDYKIPIYSNGITNDGLQGYTRNARIFRESVTVSARGTIGFVRLRENPYVPIVRLVVLIPKTDKVSPKFLYHLIDSLPIMGTGASQEQLTVPDFSKVKVLVPIKKFIDDFSKMINPLYYEMNILRTQNQNLTATRDRLLPRLLSGVLKVKA